MAEAKNKIGRNSKGQFQKGVSGNPGGRPKKPENAIEYGIAAFERIADMAQNSENEKMRFDANKWLCEIAFGKPTQATEVEGNLNTQAPLVVKFEGELEKWAR